MLELFTNLGIVAGTILALAAIVKPLYLMVRRVEQIHTKVIVELPTWQEHVDKHIKELYPNSGSSIKDQVGVTHQEMARVKQMLQEHLSDTGAHSVRQIRASIQLDTHTDGESE